MPEPEERECCGTTPDCHHLDDCPERPATEFLGRFPGGGGSPSLPEKTQIVHHIETTVSELSIDFDDYPPEAKARHDGVSLFVGVHVPHEFTKHLTLASIVTVTITESNDA